MVQQRAFSVLICAYVKPPLVLESPHCVLVSWVKAWDCRRNVVGFIYRWPRQLKISVHCLKVSILEEDKDQPNLSPMVYDSTAKF